MRLWGDGFDHYGSDELNMTDGQAYAQADCTLSTTQAATGTHSILINSASGLTGFQGLRKVLSASKDKMGIAARFYCDTLGSDLAGMCIASFQTASPNRSQVDAFIDSNGAIRFYRGDDTYQNSATPSGTLIAQTDNAIVTAAAWNHIEIQLYLHDTLGWVRVAINSIHKYQATGLDTKYNSDNIVSVSQYRPYLTGGTPAFYMDDYRLYDFVGNSAVDTDWCCTVDGSGVATNYIGELQGMLQLADGDTAEADWGKSTGSNGYPLIGKATPDDTTYIYSATVGDLSEFTLTDLPVEITYIRGLDFHSRLSKSDAGAAMYKVGMKSVADVTDLAEIPMTVEPAYWYGQIDVDPDSGVRWTRPSFNAAWLRQTRSA